MNSEILGVLGTWKDVLDDCRSTVGKGPSGAPAPTRKFRRAILLAEHSPIRDITIRWKWSGMKSWVATHFSRHKWECYVRTQRTDRTGVRRDTLPQDAPVGFVGTANAQHLIDTARKRLCHQASPETRAYMEDLKRSIQAVEPELGEVLVPNCVYRCGCPEMQCCGYWQSLVAEHPHLLTDNIQARYDIWNGLFKEEKHG